MATLQFAPFRSEIELPFYSALFKAKLDYDKFDDSARQVLGLYEPRRADPEASCKMQILGNALTSSHVPFGSVRAEGMIRNVNTIEAFKATDKTEILQNGGRQIWEAIKDGSIYSVPSLLSSFTILSFADLKKYKFTYWFGFPALHSDPAWKRTGPTVRLTGKESEALVDKLGTWKLSVDNREHGFFLAKKVRGQPPSSYGLSDSTENDLDFQWQVESLRAFETGFFDNVDEKDRYVAFVDSSTYAENPSWPLRNLLVLIRRRFHLTGVQILCFRDTQARRDEGRSIILPLATDPVDQTEATDMPKVTGWERSTNGKLQARIANLAEYMDPTRLADSAVDLNLKLMKWRIAPDLDIDGIKNTKCLLLGAGTLGCYVSLGLMGWGVRKITFVDNGKVSFSNPVRQPLFRFTDCLNGGAPKAIQAAKVLKDMYPGVESEGHELEVPMLGHPYTDEAKTKASFAKLQELIKSHDAIFLLMDSRESRWLPTVVGKAAGKIVLNAALGFDSWVAMRHGAELEDGGDKGLGCYFCNDVVAPGDSMKDQTLDQQCTVTRPGAAPMASSQLVELLAALLQHPLGNKAPALDVDADTTEPALGYVSHQLRGFLRKPQTLVVRGEAYPCCSACSPPVLGAYRKEGWEFVRRALVEKDYVTELSGLAEVQRKAEEMAAQIDSSEGEGEDEGEGELI